MHQLRLGPAPGLAAVHAGHLTCPHRTGMCTVFGELIWAAPLLHQSLQASCLRNGVLKAHLSSPCNRCEHLSPPSCADAVPSTTRWMPWLKLKCRVHSVAVGPRGAADFAVEQRVAHSPVCVFFLVRCAGTLGATSCRVRQAAYAKEAAVRVESTQPPQACLPLRVGCQQAGLMRLA